MCFPLQSFACELDVNVFSFSSFSLHNGSKELNPSRLAFQQREGPPHLFTGTGSFGLYCADPQERRTTVFLERISAAAIGSGSLCVYSVRSRREHEAHDKSLQQGRRTVSCPADIRRASRWPTIPQLSASLLSQLKKMQHNPLRSRVQRFACNEA